MKPFIFIITALLSLLQAEESNYDFGQGIEIGDSGWIVGGYLSADYIKEHQHRYADIDDVALLAYGEFDRYDFLAELEVADLYHKEIGGDDKFGKLHLERLYGDYFPEDNQRIRLGKFNSDIGFWNLNPINVLRDTTSNPNLAEVFFPKLTTGINFEQHDPMEGLHSFSVTLQNNNDIDRDYNNFKIQHHYSAVLDFKNGCWSSRIGGGNFRYDNHEASYVFGALKYQKDEIDFMTESVLRKEDDKDVYSYDVYAQGVWNYIPRHFVIVRVETGKMPLLNDHDTIGLIGYTYRPRENIALKGEYEAHDENALSRWLFSFSLLF